MTTKYQHAGIVEAYAGDEDRPLPGYLVSVATYRAGGAGASGPGTRDESPGSGWVGLPQPTDQSEGGCR